MVQIVDRNGRGCFLYSTQPPDGKQIYWQWLVIKRSKNKTKTREKVFCMFSAPVHFTISLRTRIFSNSMYTCEPNAIVFYFLFPLSLILTSMYVCVCRKLNKMKYMRDLMLDFQSKILQNLRPNLRTGEKYFLRCVYAGCSQQSWARHQWRVVWTSRRNAASAEWYSSPVTNERIKKIREIMEVKVIYHKTIYG